MKKLSISVFGLMTIFSSFAQDAPTLTPVLRDPNWKFKSILGLNGSQTSFVNWAAGGRNNISALAFADISGNFAKGLTKWDNDFKFALGAVQFLGKENGKTPTIQKTDDRIDLSTNWGYKTKEDNKWFFSALGNFRTQSLDGFNFPNDSIPISGFLAPAYGTLALGIDWKPNPNLSVFISPLATKNTWVKIGALARAGAFGVQGEERDALGVVTQKYKTYRGEFGAYAKVKYSKTLAENIEFKGQIDLFSNYAVNPGNIDVNAETLFSFKVNSWFSASLQWNLIYDDDIILRKSTTNSGPGVQFKSVLGLGVSYTVKNFDEKK